jgi:hypothetical protein
MRPGGHPLQNLTAALEVNPEQPTQGLAKLLTTHPPAQCVLLIIDPFEEIFTQAERDERNRFIECIQALQGAENCALRCRVS